MRSAEHVLAEIRKVNFAILFAHSRLTPLGLGLDLAVRLLSRRILGSPDCTGTEIHSSHGEGVLPCPRRPSAAAPPLRWRSLEPRYALATFYVSNSGSDTSNGARKHPLGHAAKGGQHGAGRRHGHRPGRQLRRLRPAPRRHGRRPHHVPGRAGRRRSRSATPITPDGINLEGADYVTIDGFTVNGMPRTGIRSVLNHHVIIRNNHARPQRQVGHSHRLQRRPADREQRRHPLAGRARHLRLQQRRPARSSATTSSWGNRANGIHMNGDASLGRRRHHQRRPGRRQRHLRQRRRRRLGHQLRRRAELDASATT